MIVHPGLTRHPKFLMFKRALGAPEAAEYLLAIWGHCQERQLAENWGKKDADYVEAIAGWTGDRGKLFAALSAEFCGNPGWIQVSKKGELIVTEWNEHNKSLLQAWANGKNGGRPAGKRMPTPREPGENPPVSRRDTPREPGENPSRGIGLDGIGGSSGMDARARESGGNLPEVNCPPSKEEVAAYGKKCGYDPDICQDFFRYWSGACWVLNEKNGRLMGDFRPFLDQRVIDLKKSAAKKSAPRGAGGMMDARQRKAALEQLIAEHPANQQSVNYNEECTPVDRKNLTQLREELEGLVREMAKGAA